MKIGGSRNCPLGTSQMWNSLPKMSVLAAEYHSQYGPLEIIFQVLFYWQSFIYTLEVYLGNFK